MDHKDEIRRSLAEQREDNYMQIEHHFKEFHLKYNHGRYLGHSYAGLGAYAGGYGGYGPHHSFYNSYHFAGGNKDLDLSETNRDNNNREIDYQWKDGHLYRKQSPGNSPDRDRMIVDKKVNSPKRGRSPKRGSVNLF